MKLLPIVLIIICCHFFLLKTYGQDFVGKEKIFTEDGAWCWFQDPRAIYVKGKHERTYAQWMTKSGQLVIGAYDHPNGDIEAFIIKENWDIDDHNVGAFLLLEDNRIMVFYARHNKEGIFCRTTSTPEEISSWEEEMTISSTTRITYAHPVYLKEEGLFYVFWRGPSWKPTFATSKDGKIWSEARILLQDDEHASGEVRPYTKITSDGISSIHFAFTNGHPNVEPQNSIYYMKYEHGVFFKANGEKIGELGSLPIQHTESDVVYDGRLTNVRSWIWDIAIDQGGYPVLAYTRLPEPDDHRYHLARWGGSEWVDQELTKGGKWFPQTPEGIKEREQQYSGGIVLNQSNPFEVFLSKQQNSSFEIEQWLSADKGNTWEVIDITSNSGHLNVRPVVPQAYQDQKSIVLWMYGNYEHYTKYNTGIKILELE